MKKLSLATLVFLFIGATLFAQPKSKIRVKTKAGAPHKNVDSFHKFYFSEDKEILSIKVDRRDLLVQRFSTESLQEKYRGELEMPKATQLEHVMKLGSRVLIFYSTHDPVADSEQLFYREVNVSSGEWNGEATMVLGTKGKIRGTMRPEYSINNIRGKFGFSVSADSTNLLIYYRKTPDQTNDNKNLDKIGLYVLNEDLNIIGGDEVQMPYPESDIIYINYSVDSQGRAYMITQIANNSRSKAPRYHIELFRKNPDSKILSNLKLGLEEYWITDALITQSPQGKVICLGLYTNASSQSEEGIFYYPFNEDFSFSMPVLIPFEKEMLPTTSARNLLLHQHLFTPEDDMILFAERYSSETTTESSAQGPSSTTRYYYGDILAIRLDPEGGLTWIRKLPKEQIGYRGEGSLSFKHDVRDGSHFLFYFDHEDNARLKPGKPGARYADGKSGHLKAYVVDELSGESENLFIMDTGNVMGNEVRDGRPSDFVICSTGQVVFEVYKKKKEDQLVQLTLN